MDNQIIKARLDQYQITTIEDEENALKEILQEIALFALATTDFFKRALFQGGTALRILYQLPRFSEDLDFILKHQDTEFQWQPYLQKMEQTFNLYGIHPEIKDRSTANTNIQKLFLKDNSIGKILNLNFQHHAHRKLMIKLEIDTNPPLGSNEEINYLEFPIDYMVVSQDLPSNFSGKCHALLCRQYTKGRDWFDLTWYISKKVTINYVFLSNALKQAGPWKNQNINVTKEWLVNALSEKIKHIDWNSIKLEAKRFVNPEYTPSLKLWSQAFFLDKMKKLDSHLN